MAIFNGSVENIENNKNKVNTIGENPTQEQYPNVQAVIDYIVTKIKEAEEYTDSEISATTKDLKKYVNDIVGDIETALDELHNYAQALINGGAE